MPTAAAANPIISVIIGIITQSLSLIKIYLKISSINFKRMPHVQNEVMARKPVRCETVGFHISLKNGNI